MKRQRNAVPTPAGDLKEYIVAANESSQRARRTLFLLSFASILVIIAFWNSRYSSWADLRYNILNAAIDRYYPDSIRTIPDVTPDSAIARHVKPFILERNISSHRQLQDLRAIVNDLRKDAYVIRVPFFGVSFDINDLGFVSGSGLTVLLFLFWFTLGREHANLVLTFEKASADREQLQLCYDLLSMRQVLTIPPSKEGARRVRWWTAPKLLFFLPFVSQLLVYLFDLSTKQFAESLDPRQSQFSLTVTLIFLVLIFVLTVVCCRFSYTIDVLWKRQAEILHNMKRKQSRNA